MDGPNILPSEIDTPPAPKHPPTIKKLLLPAPKPQPKAEPATSLPYSEDAEIGVLGSMLIDPEAASIAKDALKTTDFYLGKHRILYALLSELSGSHDYLDEVFVTDELARRNVLEQSGGRDYIGRIIIKTPSAQGVEQYCKIVREYAVQRELMDAAGKITALATKGGDVAAAASIIAEITERRSPKLATFSWGSAVEYNTENDPNTLLGHRWLSKGGSCLWVGQTGMGKSSLNAQAAAVWALGMPFFGIKPTRPLRSLIIQAENDDGDIADIARGITNGLGLGNKIAELNQNVHFAEKTAIAGDGFMPYARRLIDQFQPDLLWIDPLFAFCGCDVSDQGMMSKFLRLGLQKLAQDTGVCNMVVHHTNKPRAQQPGGPAIGEDAYSGSGTAEISNWARAVIRIKKLQGGDFELVAAKRGSRAGLVDSAGKPADSVFIKHAPRPDIYWQLSIEPENVKANAEKQDSIECFNKMISGQLYSRTELRALCASTLGVTDSFIRDPNRRAGRIFQLVQNMATDSTKMGYFVKKD